MKHNNHLKDLTLYVVKTQGPALFGEDWLHKIKLFPKRSHQSTQNKVEKVLDEYSEVFQDEICTLKSTKAKLTLKEGSKAKFCKVWPVPYTMKPEVEREMPRRRNITHSQIQQLVDTYCTCHQTQWGSTHLWKITVSKSPNADRGVPPPSH